MHSLSDDEKLYKTPAERADEAKRDPIAKLAARVKAGDMPFDGRQTATSAFPSPS